MSTKEIIDLGCIICFVAAGYGLILAIGYVIRRVQDEQREDKEREVKAKHKRIIEGDDLLNEYEIGLEWGDKN